MQDFYGIELSTQSTWSVEVSSIWHLICYYVVNVAVNSFLACNNQDCNKKINSTPGSKIVKCINCNRSMLVKNCYIDITLNFTVEKDGKEYSMTAFPKVMSSFLERTCSTIKMTQTRLLKSCCPWRIWFPPITKKRTYYKNTKTRNEGHWHWEQ